jgi:heptosyltransferase-1
MARSVLIVRLGALGDLVHAMPAVAALRAAWPEASIDWLVDGRYAALLELVPGLNRTVVIGGRTARPLRSVICVARATTWPSTFRDC